MPYRERLEESLSRLAEAMPAWRVDQVQAFAVLALELHFTRAAARLFLSQSGLSRRVRALEQSLGADLFTRAKGNRNVELTTLGEELLPYAVAILESVYALTSRVASVAGEPAAAEDAG